MFIQFSNPEMKGFSVYPARGFKTELSNEFYIYGKAVKVI